EPDGAGATRLGAPPPVLGPTTTFCTGGEPGSPLNDGRCALLEPRITAVAAAPRTRGDATTAARRTRRSGGQIARPLAAATDFATPQSALFVRQSLAGIGPSPSFL